MLRMNRLLPLEGEEEEEDEDEDQGGNKCHNPDFLGFSQKQLVLGLVKR